MSVLSLRFQTASVRRSTDSAQMIYRMSADRSEIIQPQERGVLAYTPLPIRIWLEDYIPEEGRRKVGEAGARNCH